MIKLHSFTFQIRRIVSVFSIFDDLVQKKLLRFGIGLLLTATLDLVAVGLIGVLGALAVIGVQSKQPAGFVGFILDTFKLDGLSLQSQVAYLAAMAIALLLLRTATSIFLTKRMYEFLAIATSNLSGSLLRKAFNLPLSELELRGSKEFLYSLSQGVNNLSFGVLGISIAMFSDIGILSLLSLCLLVINPITAFISLVTFSILGLTLYKLVGGKSRSLGNQSAYLYVESSNLIEEILSSFRTLFVRDQRSEMLTRVNEQRIELAKTTAQLSFLPNVGKYVIESGIILSSFIVCAIQFLLTDSSQAVAALALFLGSGTRIAPAILRIQQGAIQLQSNLGAATSTMQLVNELKGTMELQKKEFVDAPSQFMGDVLVKNLVYHYRKSGKFLIDIPNLKIDHGSFVAIVGPSGSGKSTFVDLILGINKPIFGDIWISGESPEDAARYWPTSIAYVPQNVHEIDGTLLENVSFGFSPSALEITTIKKAIKDSELAYLLTESTEGLAIKLGRNGMKLSGGERQRLGIARALVSDPKLIIMDEATSSLDAQTENKVSETLAKLKGRATLIVVAHRLSTVRNADNVIYMKNGKIIAQGTFVDVKRQVPDFEIQAALMGM